MNYALQNYLFSLKPNTKYRFRLASQNDMGISDYSRSTNPIRTKQNGKDKKLDFILYLFLSLVPIIQPKIDYLSTNQPCQLDVYLKVKYFSSILLN